MIKKSELRRGIEMAADIASQYNATSSHLYRLDDCILGKLNATRRKKPRKNPRAINPVREWFRGYATALAGVVRVVGPALGKTIMQNDNFTVADLRRAKLDGFDMRQIRKIEREGA